MTRSHRWWTCTAVLLAAPTSGADELPDPLTDRFQLSLGAFFVESAPTIRLRGESGNGDRLHWGQEFGGVDARRMHFDGYWRFSERQKVRVRAFSASRERSEALEGDIEWGGETFPTRANVEADLGFDILEVGYEHSILRGSRYELNGTVGLHYMTLDASLEARAEASSGTLSEDVRQAAKLDAPLPVVGLGGVWSLTRHLWIDASAHFFALSIDDYEGHLENYRVSLTWQLKPWLGFGAGYTRFTIDVEAEKQRLDGTLDWSYRGPLVFYQASF